EFNIGGAGKISARTRQVINEAVGDGIDNCCKNDWNGACRLPHRGYDGRGVGDDHVWRQFHQLCRIGSYAGRVTAGPAIVDAHVAAFYPSQSVKPLLQRFDPSLSVYVISDTHEHADTAHPLALLRARRERPRRRAAEQRDERAPPNHSITSSARASTVTGTSRPSAFAVLRLIVSCSVVGCWNGRSPTFSPRSTPST